MNGCISIDEQKPLLCIYVQYVSASCIMHVGSTQRDVLWRGITKTVNFTVVYGAKAFPDVEDWYKEELQGSTMRYERQSNKVLCGENFNHYNNLHYYEKLSFVSYG